MKDRLINLILPFLVVCASLVSSCRGDDEEITPPTVTPVESGQSGLVKGFFLLNEGNMGSNKASLDYFDSESGNYYLNIFPSINPNVQHELGDVGNDLQIYGSKMYAVINNSGMVEVMDVATGKHLNAITVQNCRYITFHKGYAYISSYNGPVKIEPDAPLGCVVKVDTVTMREVGRVTVGYQPEEMVVRNNKLYVANSGGYRVPNYDNTISVIDLNDFTKEQKRIPVAINLHRMELDSDENIYVSSRGDNKYTPSSTYVIGKKDEIVKNYNLPCSEMAVIGDSIYLYSVEWSQTSQKNTISYAIINTKTQQVVSNSFITDGSEKQIVMPYGLAINPQTRDIYVTDAKDYVNPGVLYCFDKTGKRKWAVVTGSAPAHIAFTRVKLKNQEILKP